MRETCAPVDPASLSQPALHAHGAYPFNLDLI